MTGVLLSRTVVAAPQTDSFLRVGLSCPGVATCLPEAGTFEPVRLPAGAGPLREGRTP